MDSGFKWAVGNIVTLRAVLEPFRIPDMLCCPRLFVVERYRQECPGGVQRHYQCRVFNGTNFRLELVSFNEIELIGIPPDECQTSADFDRVAEMIKKTLGKETKD